MYFLADWFLNILGALIILAAVAVSLGLFIGWIAGGLRKDPPPSEGLVTDTIKAGADGCGSIGLIWFIGAIMAAFGAWLIEVL